ncbi:TPA: gp53-like domain-containing protein [Salmonella enterica]|uniref:gp53-like domain-containing protein n=1 Tax=Salmonella enterica TaxID=28901 RepID=UPI0039C13708
MHRIDTKTAQKDKFGAGKNGFTRGNPQTGTPATDLDDDYFDMLQEELCSVVEASGASLEKGRNDQLLTALRALLLSRKNPFGDIKSDGTVQTALENLGLGEAAKRDVGTSNNQLPDMSAFGMSRNGQSAWDILPNGMIRQAGTVTLTPVGNFNARELGGVTYYTHYYRVNFPRQFPNAQIATLATLASYSFSTQASMAGKSLATHRDTDSGTDVSRTRFTVAYTTPNLGETPTLHFEAIGY